MAKENLTYSYPEGVLENNKEPRTKGCLAAITKIACLYVSKEFKENAKSHQRSNPVGQKQKPHETDKLYDFFRNFKRGLPFS